MAQQELPGAVRWLDDRTGIAKLGKKNLRKVFPDHWSFMLGEIALYSFIILILTGIFLTLWFRPSMAEVEYQGTYSLLKGLPMSEAYESTLRISFDIRGGLLMRQIHHWAAILFVAAMSIHLLRIFFTGAFRKPRELNWLIGIVMLFLGIIEGFIGYGLPDDLLSGTGLRITEGLVLAAPVVGTWMSFFIFGGEFPGDDFVSRFYTVHVLLIPGILLGLIALHLFLVVYHKHTQYPGPGRTEKNVVGYPLMPVYVAKAGGFFFVVFGVLAVMGALLQINPVWLYGPYNPAEVTAGSQPDWYMAWLDGAVRLMPGAESQFWGITISWNVVVPALLMPPAVHRIRCPLPLHRGSGHPRQTRAPPPRQATQPADADRDRRRHHHLLRRALAEQRQRSDRDPVPPLHQHDHLGLPFRDRARSTRGVLDHAPDRVLTPARRPRSPAPRSRDWRDHPLP